MKVHQQRGETTTGFLVLQVAEGETPPVSGSGSEEPWPREACSPLRGDDEAASRLNVGPQPRGGSNYTVGNVGYGSDETTGAEDDGYFQVVSGSSWRMVLDVGE